jgi:hypothetical protein
MDSGPTSAVAKLERPYNRSSGTGIILTSLGKVWLLRHSVISRQIPEGLNTNESLVGMNVEQSFIVICHYFSCY